MATQKKAYIAGKITGDPNYREKFAKAEEELKAQGYLVMNPAILPEGFKWDDYMEITVPMLRACDTVYMLEDWKDSRGAQTEHTIAKTEGKTILYQTPPEQPQNAPNNTKQK